MNSCVMNPDSLTPYEKLAFARWCAGLVAGNGQNRRWLRAMRVRLWVAHVRHREAGFPNLSTMLAEAWDRCCALLAPLGTGELPGL